MNVEEGWVSAKGWPGGGVGLGSGVSVSFPRYIVEIYGLWARDTLFSRRSRGEDPSQDQSDHPRLHHFQCFMVRVPA